MIFTTPKQTGFPCGSDTGRVRARPYRYNPKTALKKRFPPQKRYRAGQGSTVLVPSQSVTEKTGRVREPTYKHRPKAALKKRFTP